MQRYRLRSDITNCINKQQQTAAHTVLQQPQPHCSCTTDNGEALEVQVTICTIPEWKMRLQILAYSEIPFLIVSPSFPPSLPPFSPKALQFSYYFSKSLTQAPSPQDSPTAQPSACQRPHGDSCSETGRGAEIRSPGEGEEREDNTRGGYKQWTPRGLALTEGNVLIQ